MFRMTADVEIGSFKPVKPTGLTWNLSIENYTDTAKVELPALARLKKEGDQYEVVQTGLQLKEGIPIQFSVGYNSQNKKVFWGFIARINYSIPLEIECEGYSYLLRKKIGFTKSYKSTTVLQILQDLTAETSIVLSKAIPNIPISKAVFNNASGIDVLDWLKDKCLLTVYFNYNELYVGLMETEPKRVVKFRLGWNVIKDNDLKFNNEKEFSEVKISVEKKGADGKTKKAIAGVGSQVKVIKTLIDDEAAMLKIAEKAKKDNENRGYEGSILAFLQPFVEKGDAVNIEDLTYKERAGKYFVLGIEGSFNKSGGRQKIKIGNSL